MDAEAVTNPAALKVYSNISKSPLVLAWTLGLYFGAVAGLGGLGYFLPSIHHVSESYIEYVVILLTALLVCVIVHFGFTLLGFWEYTKWAKERKAYISFDEQAITVLGSNRVPWVWVDYIRTESLVNLGREGGDYVCLVLGFPTAQRRGALTLPDLDALTRENQRIRHYHCAQFTSYWDPDSFLSLRISDPAGDSLATYLTLTDHQIANLAEQYWHEAKQTAADGKKAA